MAVMEMAGAVWVADQGEKKESVHRALCFSGCKNTAVFGFLNWLRSGSPILSTSLLPCWHSHYTRKHSLMVLALYKSFSWEKRKCSDPD